MESRTFGKTGLRVPVIGMGTWQSYDVRDPGEVQPVTDAILAHGATFVDTSPMYGSAERVLAKTLGEHRRDVTVATKVWAGSAREGREQIRRALEWYGGVIDLYHALENDDEELAVDAYRRWGFGNISRDMIALWNKIWPDAGNTGCLTRWMPTLDLDITCELAAIANQNRVGIAFGFELQPIVLSPGERDAERCREQRQREHREGYVRDDEPSGHPPASSR